MHEKLGLENILNKSLLSRTKCLRTVTTYFEFINELKHQSRTLATIMVLDTMFPGLNIASIIIFATVSIAHVPRKCLPGYSSSLT